jgi:plastocyanin
MKRTIYFFIITSLLLFSQTVFTQTTHDVTVANFSFTPAALTITIGDTVRWTNVLGTHNVVADDNSFTSGPVAPAPWEYIHVFTTAGSNPYYCSLHGGPGGVGMSGVITVQTATDVQDKGISIYKFDLKQNYPNPFNPTTTIHYIIPERSFVELRVYDVIGNEVKTLVNEEKPAGSYEVKFSASQLSSGIYFYKLITGAFVETKKMILLR